MHRCPLLAATALLPCSAFAQAIGGRVVDRVSAKPLANVVVSVELPGIDSLRTTKTAPDGVFMLALPRPGRYAVRLRAGTAGASVSDSIDVGADEFVQREFQIAPPPEAIFFEFQVSKPAAPLAGRQGPRYPATLKDRGVEGEVLASYVVDTTGLVRLDTFKALRASDPAFAAAVLVSLGDARYRPAEHEGRKVVQVVHQRFEFRLTRGGAHVILPLSPRRP